MQVDYWILVDSEAGAVDVDFDVDVDADTDGM